MLLMLALVVQLVACVSSEHRHTGRPRNLLAHLPGHARHDLSQAPPRPPNAKLLGQPPPPTCAREYVAEAAATGMISVANFQPPNITGTDDAIAVRAAIEVAINCSAAVFFPPGGYSFGTTVVLPGGIELRGSGLGASEFIPGTAAGIGGPKLGPAFLIAHVEKVHLVDLSIEGYSTGVIVTDAALVKFSNVGVEAQWAGIGDEAPCSVNGTDGCNVVFGSNNTAVVIENSFWVWFNDCDLKFLPIYDSVGASARPSWGQRPSVIVRGNSPGKNYGIDTVYLLKFRDIVFSGGSVQYQQVVTGEQWPGFFEFLWITTEVSAVPLLDVQV
jgi:hypothetical protein